MRAEDLSEAIKSLTPEEQESVWLFIAFLKKKKLSDSSPFSEAFNEFVDQHPELLRRLAE